MNYPSLAHLIPTILATIIVPNLQRSKLLLMNRASLHGTLWRSMPAVLALPHANCVTTGKLVCLTFLICKIKVIVLLHRLVIELFLVHKQIIIFFLSQLLNYYYTRLGIIKGDRSKNELICSISLLREILSWVRGGGLSLGPLRNH